MGYFGNSRPQGGVASDKQVVFNDAGKLGGTPEFAFDKVGRLLSVENCEVLGLLAARGGLKMSTTPPPVDSPVVPGEMAFWFDPPSGLLNVLAIAPDGTATLFQLVRADDARMTDARTPVAHKHPGADVTSPVADAQNAGAVPWSGVTGKPASFPPASHQHAGGDITSPVANANAAAIVPWSGITGTPAQFPPAAHTHPPAGASGDLQFNDNGTLGGAADLKWDGTNKRLGVGTAPQYALDVAGPVHVVSPQEQIGTAYEGLASGSISVDTGLRFTWGSAVFGLFFFGRFTDGVAVGEYQSFSGILVKRVA